MRTFLLISLCVFMLSACSNENHKDNRIHKTEHFEFHFTSLDEANIEAIADSLEYNYDYILNSLQSDSMPKVQVNFYTTIEDLKLAVKDVEPNLPDFAIGLATNVAEIHLLSPNHPNLDFQYMVKNTIHEFVHCVSYNINPNIANNPRWLWEAVAQYESGQVYSPTMFDYLVAHHPPTIDKLNLFTNTYIYEVGGFIAEFLVHTHGEPILHTLIENNGDIETSLGMTEQELTEAWFDFAKEKYGIW